MCFLQHCEWFERSQSILTYNLLGLWRSASPIYRRYNPKIQGSSHRKSSLLALGESKNYNEIIQVQIRDCRLTGDFHWKVQVPTHCLITGDFSFSKMTRETA